MNMQVVREIEYLLSKQKFTARGVSGVRPGGGTSTGRSERSVPHLTAPSAPAGTICCWRPAILSSQAFDAGSWLMESRRERTISALAGTSASSEYKPHKHQSFSKYAEPNTATIWALAKRRGKYAGLSSSTLPQVYSSRYKAR